MSLKLRKIKTIKKDYLLLLFLLLFSIGKAQEPPSSEDYNYNTFEAQKKWIIGTFLDDEDHNTELTFTKDGRCIWKYLITGDSTDYYTYTIEYSTRKADTPSGHINVYTLYLKAIPADPNEDLTYEMYIDDTGLALYPWPMGIGGQFVLSRVKPKESTSSKTPSKEEEKESEVSPRRELKSSDYNRGYLDGGLSYERCKKEQGKESEASDGYRMMPISIEGMGSETVEYQAEFQRCKKGFFYGIKWKSNEYQRGFEEGWRDAAISLNKEKEKTKKKQ